MSEDSSVSHFLVRMDHISGVHLRKMFSLGVHLRKNISKVENLKTVADLKEEYLVKQIMERKKDRVYKHPND